MHKTIALTTALTVFAMLPANPAAAADVAQLLMEEHYTEAGYEFDLYVTRGADDEILSEATLTDPATGEAVDVWTDGTTVWWNGTIDGEPVRGSMAADDVIYGDPASPLFCFTPVTAVLCLGAVVVLLGSSSCATTKGPCPLDPSSEIPDGGGGVPPDDGGGGNGDGGGGGSGGGGDDED